MGELSAVVTCHEQKAGRNDGMNVGSDVGMLGTALVQQNSIQEEIKSRLKLGNACYHSVQNLLSSSLLSKNL